MVEKDWPQKRVGSGQGWNRTRVVQDKDKRGNRSAGEDGKRWKTVVANKDRRRMLIA